MTYDQIVARFPGSRQLGEGKVAAPCPAHEDSNPSLSISRGTDGRTVLHCHAGCTTADVLSAVGLVERDLFTEEKPARKSSGGRIVSTYSYRDAAVTERYQVTRWEPKDFRPRRAGPNGEWIWNLTGVERIPYRLPEILAAPADAPIYIAEGEKDADALAALGMVATTNPGGCGSTKLWDTRPFRDPLVGRHVVVIPDADVPGRKHAAHVAAALAKVAKSIKVIELSAKDVSDWLAAGHAVEELRALVADAPEWTAPARPAPAAVVAHAIARPGEYRFSESEAARRFGDILRGRAVFTADAGVWYFHDGQRFTKDHGNGWMLGESLKVSHAYAEDAARGPRDANYQDRLDIAKRYNGLAGRKRLIELVTASTEGLRVMAAQFDRDPWLLNCLNGTIDLHTGQLRPHNTADLLTKLAPVAFDPGAKCPRWEQFLGEVLPDAETIAFVQLFVGFCLTGSTKNHVVAFLYGAGANGKSVLSETITTMLGDYAATLPATVLMAKEYQGHACELMPLRGARWALFRELPAGKFDEPKVKAFASADIMTARNLFEGPVSWAPTHKVVLTGNHKPIVRGQDEGIWRRLKLIPFDRVVLPEKRDLDLPAKLRAELPGILNWSLTGCMAWQADPLVLEKACAAVVAATTEYREESDRLAPYLGECCILAPDARVTRAALRASYEAWCSREGEHPSNPRDFGERLRLRGVADAKLKVAGEAVRGWQGIGLLTDSGKGGQVDTIGQQYPLTPIDSLSHEGDRGKHRPPLSTCPPHGHGASPSDGEAF